MTVATALTIGLSIWDLMGRAAYSAFMAAAVLSVCAIVLVGMLVGQLRFESRRLSSRR